MNGLAYRHWQRGREYLQHGQMAAAHAELDALRKVSPSGLHRHLLEAQIAWYTNQVREARRLVLSIPPPNRPNETLDLIEILLLVGAPAAAHTLFLQTAWSQVPEPTVWWRGFNLCRCFDEHDNALRLLDQLGADTRWGPTISWYRGEQLEFLGQIDAAAEAYRACLAHDPMCGAAARQWARLPGHARSAEVARAISVGTTKVMPNTLAHADFEFARYSVAEAHGDAKRAWEALSSANAIMHRALAGAAHDQQLVADKLLHLAERMQLQSVSQVHSSYRPIFIIGLPRSGTTVLARMLGNHSQVRAAGELPDFAQQLMIEAGVISEYTDEFYANLTRLNLANVGAAYISETSWRAKDKRCLVDKQPANWMLVGWIHAALPHAKILHLVRDPMDVLFSNWRARFADRTHAWSYNFASMCTYYATYRKQTQIWHEYYPNAILDVAYADLVSDPTTTLRSIFAYCDLEYEPHCDDLTRNHNPEATLSTTEIREPVHTRAIGQWRRYATQLQTLQNQLRKLTGCPANPPTV